MAQQLNKVADAARKLASHPQLQSALSQAQTMGKQVTDKVTTNYSKSLSDNSKYVLKDDKAKAELAKTAFYTGMAEIPLIARRSQAEASEWWQATRHTVQNLSSARAGDVFTALLFSAELCACFKVGEFFGRGCTLFGYWP